MVTPNTLRGWRELRGYTQAELAERAGVRRATVADIEAGRKTPLVTTALDLVDALTDDGEDPYWRSLLRGGRFRHDVTPSLEHVFGPHAGWCLSDAENAQRIEDARRIGESSIYRQLDGDLSIEDVIAEDGQIREDPGLPWVVLDDDGEVLGVDPTHPWYAAYEDARRWEWRSDLAELYRVGRSWPMVGKYAARVFLSVPGSVPEPVLRWAKEIRGVPHDAGVDPLSEPQKVKARAKGILLKLGAAELAD